MNKKQQERIRIHRRMMERQKQVVMVGKITPTEAVIFVDPRWGKK